MHVVGCGQGAHLAAAIAGQCDDAHTHLVRDLYRVDHVRGIAARRDGEQHIAAPPERAHLLGEHLLVGIIVRNRRKRRRVRSKGDAGKRRALAFEAVDELGREVLRIGRRAAVAASEHLATAFQRCREQRAGLRHRLPEHRHCRQLQIRALGEMRRHARHETCFCLLHAATILWKAKAKWAPE